MYKNHIDSFKKKNSKMNQLLTKMKNEKDNGKI